MPKVSVSRTAPSGTDHSSVGASPRADATSVEPPPMSSTSAGASGARPRRTPAQMSRASSRPETTSSRRPVAARTRFTTSGPFFAWRTALVATARTRAW